MSREVRVGLLVIVALVVLVAGLFLVGERENLLTLKNDYFIHFSTVAGLASGNPVQLNGVTVGKVKSIVLPEAVDETLLTVWISIDRRFAARVRRDSAARIKTLGLLGDKYIELTSGSAGSPEIAPRGEIAAAPATDIDQLLASGEDVAENVVAISVSLRSILGRMEAGEGILGELTIDTEAGRLVKEAIVGTIESIEQISRKIESGPGTLAALLNDDGLLRRIEGTVDRAEELLGSLETGDGALPALIHDPETRSNIEQAISRFNDAAEDLASVAERVNEGQGLVAKLLNDRAYDDEVSEDLKQLIRNLNILSARLESGDGTLAQLINDPQVYDALTDVVVGINESKMLRWLIQNRQKAGLQERFKDEASSEEGSQ